jgi:hypothetical protein
MIVEILSLGMLSPNLAVAKAACDAFTSIIHFLFCDLPSELRVQEERIYKIKDDVSDKKWLFPSLVSSLSSYTLQSINPNHPVLIPNSVAASPSIVPVFGDVELKNVSICLEAVQNCVWGWFVQEGGGLASALEMLKRCDWFWQKSVTEMLNFNSDLKKELEVKTDNPPMSEVFMRQRKQQLNVSVLFIYFFTFFFALFYFCFGRL